MSNKILCRGDLISLESPDGLCLTAEPTFDGTGDVRCAVAKDFSETCVFQIISKKGSFGSSLLYGEEIQLMHVSTGLFLVTMQVGAELERQCFKLLLKSPDSTSRSFEDLSIFSLLPRYKLRNEGEPACEDPVLFQANLPSHFPHYVHLSEMEVNVSLQSTAWLPRIYRSANVEAGLLQAGLVLRLQHREYDSYLKCSPDPGRVPRHAKSLVDLCSLDHTAAAVPPPPHTHEEEKQLSYRASSVDDRVTMELAFEDTPSVWSLWVIQHADVKNGAAITWNEPFRLRHLMTGKYLGIDQAQWDILAKPTHSTLLQTLPSSAGPLRQGACGRLRSAHTWLATQNSNSHSQSHNSSGNNHKHKELVASNEVSVVDAYVFVPVAVEEIRNCAFVQSRRAHLIRLSESLRSGDVRVLETTAQVEAFVQALEDLARFSTVSDGTQVVMLRGNPILDHQVLLMQEDTLLLVVDILHHALEIYSQLKQAPSWGSRRVAHAEALATIVPVAYTVLRLAVTGNKITQNYVANYLPLLQRHLFFSDPITTQVLDLMRFVYTDNTALVESVKTADLLLYLTLLDNAENAVKAPDFLSVFCHSGLAGIRQNQELFLQHLPAHFIPKLRLRSGTLELQEEKSNNWVDLEAWFDPKIAASVNFRTKFRFLRSLTLGRNQRGIDFIRSVLSFDCLLAILKSAVLPFDLKRNVCEVLNRTYVDCTPHVQVVGTVPLIRADKQFLHAIREADEKVEHSHVQIASQLKSFLEIYLDDNTLLNPKEWDIRLEQYTKEHWWIIHSISMFTLLRKMVSFGWYTTGELPRLSNMLIRVLAQSPPVHFRAKTERNHDVALAKREILKTLDLILSDSISRLVDQWLDAKRSQSSREPPDLPKLVHRDFGIVSGRVEEVETESSPSKKGYQALAESKSITPSKENVLGAEAHVRHVLFNILLHDDPKLEHTATRLLMRLYNQHSMIIRVLQTDLVLEGPSDHEAYVKIQRHVESLKYFLYYNTWESNSEQVLQMFRAMTDLVVNDGDVSAIVQSIFRNMNLHTIVFGFIHRVVLPSSTPTNPEFYRSQDPTFRALALEAYRLLYYHCYESAECALALATPSNVHTMVQHLGVSEFVVKLLYSVVKGNNSICEALQPAELDSIVACYHASKNPLFLKLLAMLMQPNPQDIPIRLVQNQVCALLLHPKYALLGEDLEATLLNSTAQVNEKKTVEPVIDPLDFDEALPPAYHVLATLAMCTKGHNMNAEQRCHNTLSLDRLLFHLFRADISLGMRAVLLSFLHEVYVASSFAQGFLPPHSAAFAALVESCLGDVAILATSEFKKFERNSKLTHAALKRESKTLAKKPLELLQPQTREVFVLDVFLPFLADLLNVRDVIQPPIRARLGEVITNTFQERARLPAMLGVAVAGWSHEWTDRSGIPILRAKSMLSVIDGVGLKMGGVIEELNNIAKNALGPGESKSSATEQLRFRGSAALSGRLQEQQNEALAMLTEMFSTSLRIVMAGVVPEGPTETKLDVVGHKAHHHKSGSKGNKAGEIELVANNKEKSDEIDDKSRPAHNAFLWEAIVRFLTRQQDLSHKEGEVSIHLVDDAAHHTSADTLLGILDVISRMIEGAHNEERRKLQAQLMDLHMLTALLSIVIHCEKHEAVIVKAFQVIIHIVRGGLATTQLALLECLRTPIGHDFMHAMKSHLHNFAAKIDPESLPRHSQPEVATVMCIIEFVRLCFDGENLPLQMFLNGQDGIQHVALVEELGTVFDHFSSELVKLIVSEHQIWLHGTRVRTFLMRGKQDDPKVVNTHTYYKLASTFLKTFTDACLGRCHLSHAILARTALPGVMRFIESIHANRASKAGAELEVPAYEFWLSLLEGMGPDQEAVRNSFLEILNLDVAMDSLTAHWKQSEVQCRPPLRRNFQPNHECQLLFSVLSVLSLDTRVMTPKFLALNEQFNAWLQNRSKLLKRSIVSVEFVREDRLQRISFPVPHAFRKSNAEFRAALKKVHMKVSRGELSVEEKLKEFLRLIDGLVSLAETEASLARLPLQVLVKLVRRQLWWKYGLVLCLIINILVVTFTVQEAHLPETPYAFKNDWVEPTVIALGACFVVTQLLTVTRFMLSLGSQLLSQYFKEERDERQSRAMMLEGGYQLPLRLKVWLKFLSTPLVLYYIVSLITSILGLAWSPFFFAFHLLDAVLHNGSMNYMFEVVFRRWRHILATIAIACIVAYFFSVISFVFHLEYEFPESPYDCHTMAGCVQMHFDRGFHEAPHWEHPTVALPVAYNLALFFMIEIMLVGLVTGIIIDSFTEMRTISETVKRNMKNQCFICAIDRETFDFKTLGFRYHIKHEHRMWNYMFLREFLREKQATGRALSGHERYLLAQFEARSIAFFPLKRALSLEQPKLT